jgi:hypothetical protein
MAIVLPAFSVGDTLRPRAVWTGGNGDEIHLTDCPAGVDVAAGRAGEDMPPFEMIEDDVPDGDGTVVRGVRALPRTYLLPLIVKGAEGDYAGFRALQQRLLAAFSPLSGDGRLRIQQPDGTSRVLTCRYESGAEGDQIREPGGRLWYRKWAIKLRAHDPWWYAAAAQTVTFTAEAPTGFFPILPAVLTRGQLSGETTLTLEGDVRTWGLWTVHGPARGVTVLRSATLGREFRVDFSGDHALDTGQAATIDMRPGRVGIRGPAGQPWWSARASAPSMWWLQPGVNDVEISVAGGEAGTSVDFTYTPRFLSA